MIAVVLRYWKPIAVVGLSMVLLAIVYGLGYTRAANHYEVVLLEQQRAYDAVHQEARQALDALEMETNARVIAADALAAARTRKTEIAIREVNVWRTKYAKNPDAGKCNLPTGFVLAHNAAATNRVPEDPSTSGAATAGASGITDAELEPVVADNYALYHRCRDVLRGWGDYYGAIASEQP